MQGQSIVVRRGETAPRRTRRAIPGIGRDGPYAVVERSERISEMGDVVSQSIFQEPARGRQFLATAGGRKLRQAGVAHRVGAELKASCFEASHGGPVHERQLEPELWTRPAAGL